MPVIGLTGCPGAGKTIVAGILKELGAAIISGDQIGKEVVDSSPKILNSLTKAFGAEILDDDGKLLRRKLGKIAFSSPTQMSKLDQIVHPPLLIELKRQIEAHPAVSPQGLLVVDAALIFEWGIADWFDKIITVHAEYWLRIKRLVSSGLTEKEAQQRTDAQLNQEEKIRRADITIENNRMVKDLGPVVKKIYQMLSSLSS